jgi:hypothetical protein
MTTINAGDSQTVSGDEYELRIRETETDVNPTVNYDIIRVR